MHRKTLTIGLAIILPLALPLGGCAGGPTTKSTSETVDDAVITSKVKTSLFRDPVVSGFAVNVETYKGHVQLSGFVDTSEQKTRAQKLAREVVGVEEVVNNLIVKGK